MRGQRLREHSRIHQREVHALPELGTQRVRGIAEDGHAFAVPLLHAYIVISRCGDLRVRVDLREKTFRLRRHKNDIKDKSQLAISISEETQMHFMRSITSRLYIVAAASALLLSGCGGGDSAQAPQATVLAATTQSTALTPATVRIHFRRAQHDEAAWGVYSWWGPVHPSPAWITGRFMMSNSDSFGGYVDIPVDTSKGSMMRPTCTDSRPLPILNRSQ